MPDYSKSKIYKITSNNIDEIYIGATTQLLAKRKASHIAKYKCYLEGKYHYTTSFKLIELGDVSICLLEEFPCENKEQLYAREHYHIENNNCVNKDKSYRNNLKYQEIQAKVINDETSKIYREKNKEKIKEQYTIRHAIKYTCECGDIITKQHRYRHEKSSRHINTINKKDIPI